MVVLLWWCCCGGVVVVVLLWWWGIVWWFCDGFIGLETLKINTAIIIFKLVLCLYIVLVICGLQ